jgi:hypothetical protein
MKAKDIKSGVVYAYQFHNPGCECAASLLYTEM